MTQDCLFPPPVAEQELLAYIDGQADQPTISHLKACAYCREKAETLARFEKNLANRLYRFECPPPVELGEYHLRVSPASQMLIIAQHLRECPHCAREVAQLQSYLSDLETPSNASLLEKTKVRIAQLIGSGTDSFAPAAALRGEGKGPVTFAAEEVVIVLDIQPASDGKANILGQVAADPQEDWSTGLVELRTAHQPRISTRLDDLGAFQCKGITPGEYELQITSRHGTVVVISSFQVPA